ncbi:hypothetical protein C8R44DRAFT_868763 [Mycena epipterygia]|nr:hypothetical protein C8R44DRAFT_868763 [Mycena epipterygia]
MLTRRAAKSILRFLPNEILTEILALCPPADRAALCRASRLFNKLGTRLLYRGITLKTTHGVLKCCRTLGKNSELSLFVKSLDVGAWLMEDCDEFDDELAPLISAALECLQHLETLILGPGCGTLAPDYIALIFGNTFTRLRRLHIRIGIDIYNEPALVQFLQSHPRLTVLKLFGRPFHPSSFAGVRLPDLCYLKAKARLFSRMVHAHNRLTGAEIAWKRTPEDIAPPIAALRSGSRESLVKLVCYRPGGNVDLIQHIAEHLPLLAVLKVISPVHSYPQHDEATLQAIAAALARFTKLHTFEYTYTVHTRRVSDRATVAEWGRVCPTLKRCTLNSVIWKRRQTTDEWRSMVKKSTRAQGN